MTRTHYVLVTREAPRWWWWPRRRRVTVVTYKVCRPYRGAVCGGARLCGAVTRVDKATFVLLYIEEYPVWNSLYIYYFVYQKFCINKLFKW